MQRHGLTWVIVTRGKRGAFLLGDSGGVYETQPRSAIEVVDTVGAGDAFASVCILGLLHDWQPGLIMQRAQHFASLLVGQRGATINDPATYRSMIEAWQLAQ